MLTLRALFDMIGGVQGALATAGAWDADPRAWALFSASGSDVRFLPPGTERSCIVDCSRAPWLTTLERLIADLRHVMPAAFALGVYGPGSNALVVLQMFDDPSKLDPYLRLRRTTTGASLYVGGRRLDDADLDESFLAAVARVPRAVSQETIIAARIEQILQDPHGSEQSESLHGSESEEAVRKAFRTAHRAIEKRLGAAASTTLKPGGRSAWWRHGSGSVALWEAPYGSYVSLHVRRWHEGDPPELPPKPGPDDTIPPPPEELPTRQTPEERVTETMQRLVPELSAKCAAWARDEGVDSCELVGLASHGMTYVMRRTDVFGRMPRVRGLLKSAPRQPGHLAVILLDDDPKVRSLELLPVPAAHAPPPRLTADERRRVEGIIEREVFGRPHILSQWMFSSGWDKLYVALGPQWPSGIAVFTYEDKPEERHRPLLEAAAYRAEYDRFRVLIESEPSLPPVVVWADPVRLKPENAKYMENLPMLGPTGGKPPLDLVPSDLARSGPLAESPEPRPRPTLRVQPAPRPLPSPKRMVRAPATGDVVLVLCASALEPWRAGESTVLPLGSCTFAGLRWVQARPDGAVATAPLAAPAHAARIVLHVGAGLGISAPDGCPLYVDGAPAVGPQFLTVGNTIRIGEDLLFYVTRREPFAARRYFPTHMTRAFGQLDAANVIGESPLAWGYREQLGAASRCTKGVMLHGSWLGGRRAGESIHQLSGRTGPFRDGSADIHISWNVVFYGNAERGPDDTEHDGILGYTNHGTLYIQLHKGRVPARFVEVLEQLDEDGGLYWPIADTEARKTTFCLIINGDEDTHLERLPEVIRRRIEMEVVIPCLNDRREDIPIAATDRILRQLDQGSEKVAPFVRTDADGRRYTVLPPRSVERLMRMDHGYFDDVAERTLYEELERLEKEGLHLPTADACPAP